MWGSSLTVIYGGGAVLCSKIVARCVVGGVAAVAALGGCASDGASNASTDALEPLVEDSRDATGLVGPVMRHLAPRANEGDDAEVRGVVEIEGDCLYVSLDEIGERYPVVWPASTSWDPDTRRVRLPDGESIGHGDSVYGGGGYRSVGDVRTVAGDAAADLARQCVDNRYGEIAVVNNQPEAIGVGDQVVGREESSVESGDPSELDGDWVVDELVVDGVRVELDPAWPATVTLGTEMISGIAACNQFMGAIDWTTEAGGGRFVVSELSWTKRGCEPQAMKVEQSFLTALQAADSYEAADGLYVAKAGSATGFHLVRAVPTN